MIIRIIYVPYHNYAVMNFTSCATDQTTGWTCGTYGREGKFIEDLGRRPKVKKPLGRRGRRWEYVKFYLKK